MLVSLVDFTVNGNMPEGLEPFSWQEQRSDIRDIVLRFDEPVNPAINDLEFYNLGVDAPQDEDTALLLHQPQITSNENTVSIAFERESLQDGFYQLRLYENVVTFHRFGGDFNGDGGVSIFDFSAIRDWFGTSTPPAPEFADLNQDAGVSVFDLARFAQNFGTGIDSPPTVVDVVHNDGIADPPDVLAPTNWANQCSLVRSMAISFSETIQTVLSDSLVLTNLGVDAPNDPDRDITLTGEQITTDGSRLTLTLPNEGLADGVYKLRIRSNVTDSAGNELDGNGDGVGGDDYVLRSSSDDRFKGDAIFALQGDFNCDGEVTIFDFNILSYWLGAETFPEYVDLNNDGVVSDFDLGFHSSLLGNSVHTI